MREPEDAARHPAIDVYSLGATFFEMLSGERLFADKRNRHQMARAVAETIPGVPTPAGYPRSIAALVREMLAKSPGARPTLDEVRHRLAEITAGIPVALTAPVEPTLDDLYGQVRQAMASREDVRRGVERQRHKDRRWEEFEAMWDRLEEAWKPGRKRLTELPAILEAKIYWRGSELRDVQWQNQQELAKSFPDRQWDWGRSFDFVVALPATGVQVVYFLHGLEDHRTGITRFVATWRPGKAGDTPVGATIQVNSAESWMAPLETAIENALNDVAAAERLAIVLLSESNRVSD